MRAKLLSVILALATIPQSAMAYNFGRTSIVDAPMNQTALQAEHANWMDKYSWYTVYTGDPNVDVARVARAGWNSGDTVSEGQAYGALIAYYMNTPLVFDLLYAYWLEKSITVSTGERVPLMHWRVHPDGTLISEFGIPVPHSDVFATKNSLYADLGGGLGPNTTPGAVDYINSLEYENTLDTTYYLTRDGVQAIEATFGLSPQLKPESENKPKVEEKLVDPGGPFVPLTGYPRESSSASDADFDMAAALCFAAKTWDHGDRYNYVTEAAAILRAIMDWDVTLENDVATGTSHYFITNGSAWGGWEAWNPSYFTPAWYRVYIQFINEHPELFDGYVSKHQDAAGNVPTGAVGLAGEYARLIQDMYLHIARIDQENANGMFPDWVDTSPRLDDSGNPVLGLRQAYGSDRKYYPGDLQIAWASDGYNDPGVEWNSRNRHPWFGQSYNYYYDAIRTNWRLAVDYSWFGDVNMPVSSILLEMAYGFPDVGTIVDGYNFKGGPWEEGYRDGFNPSQGGMYTNQIPYISMIATSKMALTEPSQPFYDAIVAGFISDTDGDDDNGYDGADDPEDAKYGYYPNALRMLSLIYLTGNMQNPYGLDPAAVPGAPPVASGAFEGDSSGNPKRLERYAWGDPLDLSSGYIWVRIDASPPGEGNWGLHHTGEPFNVIISNASESMVRASGTSYWTGSSVLFTAQEMADDPSLLSLIKIERVDGATSVILQSW